MDSTVNRNLTQLCRLLEEHNCRDVLALDLSGRCSWTEGFIIATVNSRGHLAGLLRRVDEALEELEVKRLRRWEGDGEEPGSETGEIKTWLLLDCGDFIIHLMNEKAREFYELEKVFHFVPRMSAAPPQS
ncbi:MAG: ribosome silencing factor [Spirochaetales bacterium]|jgi:ribosome-associated protein|nr:ribosome silencing factor [Spirochaetales bacterium]